MNLESVFDCLLTVSQVHLLLFHLDSNSTDGKDYRSGSHSELTVRTDKHRESGLSTTRSHEAGMIPVPGTLWK